MDRHCGVGKQSPFRQIPLVFFSPTPKGEDVMEKHRMHYETLLNVTQAISMGKDPGFSIGTDAAFK
jgi:hypothetical protein